jgi:GTPase SAR1 family protein
MAAGGGGGAPVAEPRLEAAEDAAAGIAPSDLKIILLGDSAVGKSKLVERFLMDNYHPRQRSTYALTLYRHDDEVDEDVGGAGGAADAAGGAADAAGGAADAAGGAGAGAAAATRKRKVAIDFWDTAGQERFASMHASYYYKCVARARARGAHTRAAR